MGDDPKKEPADAKPDDTLGDAGKKALEAERKARREAEQRAKDFEDRLKQIEDKDKSEVEKLTAKVAEAEKRAADAEAKALRYEVAAEKGVKARWLSGSTREELEAAADEYLADHPTADGGEKKPTPSKPAEDLKGGGDPTTEPDVDLHKVVAEIPRGF
ncbi:MAG TPA: hypothetical protein VM345_01970 [Acidimicrobiales bacterium]|nr:hypothetical protein [Acidimicrobiales bacterium]